MDRVRYSKYSNDRVDGKNIFTNIVESDTGRLEVRKYPQGKDDVEYVNNMYSKYELVKELFQGSKFEANVCQVKEGYCAFEYIDGITLEKMLDDAVNDNNMQALADILTTFRQELLKITTNSVHCNNMSSDKIFGNLEYSAGLHIVNVIDLDILFSNIIVSESKWTVIDYEWTIKERVPIEYILWRALYYYMQRMPSEGLMSQEELYEMAGILPEQTSLFEQMEQMFQKYTKGDKESNHDLLYKHHIGDTVFLDSIMEKCHTPVIVYWRSQGGFDEQHSKKMDLHGVNNHECCVECTIPEDTTEIRIQFGYSACFVIVEELVLDDQNANIIQFDENYNGFIVQERGILFDSRDPNVTIHIIDGRPERLRLKCRIEKVSEEFASIYIESYEASSKKIQKEYAVKLGEKNEELMHISDLLRERETRLGVVENAYNTMLFSRSWNMTKPLRKIAEKLRRITWLKKGIRGIHYCRKYGLRPTMSKALGLTKYRIVEIPQIHYALPTNIERDGKDALINIPQQEKMSGSIAVHIHLFYVDLLGEFVGYLNHIPYEFDLFISCQEGTDTRYVKKFAKTIVHVKNVDVQIVPNRGRDIAPLFVEFGRKIEKYDYFLHAHSKKSFYSGSEKVEWRRYSLNSILGSEEMIRKIFWLFENENVGLIYPDDHAEVPNFAYSWLSNATEGKKLLEKIKIPMKQGIFSYPLGSFYWAKTDAVRQLFDLQLELEDFPEEAKQTDGTLAHAIERTIGIISEHNNYHNVLLDYEEGLIRKDFSLKPFRGYLAQNIDTTVDVLKTFDVISFDIFDTLITRCIYNPDDLFKFMGHILFEKYGDIFADYLVVRKKAEGSVWQQKGASTSIEDIYNEIQQMLSLTDEQRRFCQDLEVQLEYDMVIPREEMRQVFDQLIHQNKRIILVSDMYLDSKIIRKFLEKCGYEGYERIYVSCDVGLRKDMGNIWEEVYSDYPHANIIHVGDNMHSDCQILCDQHRPYMWIASAKDEMTLSHKSLLTTEQIENINNSLVLGLVFNKCIFNSPFALRTNGNFEFENSYDMGFSIFGPLFYEFTQWLDATTPSNAYLAFLAREGYILKQVYDVIHEEQADKARKNCYFLASRRAVTVAGARTDEDLLGIIGIPYVGSSVNLFKERFDVDVSTVIEDRPLRIGLDNSIEESRKLLDELGEAKNILYAEADKERKAYLEYMRQTIPEQEWENIVVVDVGYSGTIQYYLARLLESKVDGAYLATFGRTKPDKIGCECPAMYDITSGFSHEIERTQLFLEAVLQAPYGQLVRFENEDSNLQGIYKVAPVVPKTIKRLQTGILEYCGMRAKYAKLLGVDETCDNTVTQQIYCEYMNGWHISEKMAKIFEVEDGYCSSNYLTFNKEKNTWNY